MDALTEINFIWFVQVLKRRLRLIATFFVLVIVVVVILMQITPPSYRATTTLMILPASTEQTGDLNTLLAGERLALTYSQLITSRPILEEVIAQNGLSLSLDELEESITVEAIRDTQLIRVSITASSPSLAQKISNSVAATFVSYVQNLANQQYQRAIEETQQKIEAKRKEILEIETELDEQNQKRVEYEVELLRANTQLTENRTTYQNLQKTMQDLQLSIEEVSGQVKLVESPRLLETINPPPYSAVATILYDEAIFAGGGGFSNPQSGVMHLADGSLQIRESLLASTIEKLELETTPQELQTQILLTPLTGTQLIRLRVKGETPEQALLLCDTLAQELITHTQNRLSEPYLNRINSIENELVILNREFEDIQNEIKNWTQMKTQNELTSNSLENELNTKNQEIRDLLNNQEQLVFEASRAANLVSIAEPASLPAEPTRNWILYGALASVVTLFIAIGLAIFLELSGEQVITPQNVNSLLNDEPLAIIGHNPESQEKIVVGTQHSPEIAEDFKKLAAQIKIAAQRIPLRTILITSPTPQEGKTFVTANLGLALSRAGIGVILIDADLHLPQLHRLFKVEKSIGLTDALSHPNHAEWLKSVHDHNLKLLTSGDAIADPVELLSSSRLQEILNRLSKENNLVLIDCPPMLTLADTSYLSVLVDGIILVLRSGKTCLKDARKAFSLLQKLNKKYLGIVLNDEATHTHRYYLHYEDSVKTG